MAEEMVINSLSEYINEIEKFPSSKLFFRGEPKEYRERTLSALRQYKGIFNDKKEYLFSIMIDDFYREIIPILSKRRTGKFHCFCSSASWHTNFFNRRNKIPVGSAVLRLQK